MQHFKNVYKIYHKQNFNCLVFFKSDRPVCNHLNVNFIEITLKTIFFLKKSIFAFLTKKLWSKRKLLKNIAKRLPIKIQIYRQKIISILLAFGQKEWVWKVTI